MRLRSRGGSGCRMDVTGADDGTRTRNLLFTKQLLYQLSYVGATGRALPQKTLRRRGMIWPAGMMGQAWGVGAAISVSPARPPQSVAAGFLVRREARGFASAGRSSSVAGSDEAALAFGATGGLRAALAFGAGLAGARGLGVAAWRRSRAWWSVGGLGGWRGRRLRGLRRRRGAGRRRASSAGFDVAASGSSSWLLCGRGLRASGLRGRRRWLRCSGRGLGGLRGGCRLGCLGRLCGLGGLCLGGRLRGLGGVRRLRGLGSRLRGLGRLAALPAFAGFPAGAAVDAGSGDSSATNGAGAASPPTSAARSPVSRWATASNSRIEPPRPHSTTRPRPASGCA